MNTKENEKNRSLWYAAPWEILRQLPGLAGYLKGGLTMREVDGWSRRQTDIQVATAMQPAKRKLFAISRNGGHEANHRGNLCLRPTPSLPLVGPGMAATSRFK